MPLFIVRYDITKMNVDAIVNAANSSLLGGGGVDGCIHRAAGDALLAECRALGGCPTGEARITGAGRLPCRYVIHAVGPRWRGGHSGEKELLASCYRSSLSLAQKYSCKSVAFPLISSGIYGYPKDQALRVAVDSISAFLLKADASSQDDMTVYLVVFDRQSYTIGEKLFSDIREYIDDRYVQASEAEDRRRRELRRFELDRPAPTPAELCEMSLPKIPPVLRPASPLPPSSPSPEAKPAAHSPQAGSLEEALSQIDESFSEMLLRLIDERGITDAQCYKKANIDRKLFSKIRSDRLYKPSKPTVLAFAIALELSLSETEEMLRKAGFALSRSNSFDIIIEYFIRKGIYNVFEINEALFAFDQPLLGV